MAYARGVVSGEIVACLYVRQACQRHLDDLQRSLDPLYPYRFDEAKGHRICWFVSKLPHVKGAWAKPVNGIRRTIHLEPWQCFILAVLFGWVSKTNGLRRFRSAYIEVPRKNAKSTLAAGVGLYMFACDGEAGAEVYSGATKEKQAMEVFRPARRMAQLMDQFQQKFGIEVNKKSLTRIDESRFEPLVKNPGDGSSPSCAIVDEYHEHTDATLHDAMDTGMGARQQPLMFVITTAGTNTAGPCYLLRSSVIKVLGATVEDERRFGLIYTLDEGDDWRTEVSARKANPNFGVSVMTDYLETQRQQAINYAHKQNIILTKHFGLWMNAATAWMNMESWRAAADPALTIEKFRKQPCWQGCDLAAKIDLASRILLFKQRQLDPVLDTETKTPLIDGPTGKLITEERDHYYCFGYHYVPKQRAFDGEHEHYAGWVNRKQLIAVEGAEIRLSQIEQDLRDSVELYDMKTMAFDPWSALQMQQNLEAEFGDEVVLSVPQTTQYLSDPMKEIQAAVYSGRFHHNGDPVLTWAMSNVEVREGNNESLFPRKGADENLKIDPVAALITAMNRCYTAPVAVPKRYRALVL